MNVLIAMLLSSIVNVKAPAMPKDHPFVQCMDNGGQILTLSD